MKLSKFIFLMSLGLVLSCGGSTGQGPVDWDNIPTQGDNQTMKYIEPTTTLGKVDEDVSDLRYMIGYSVNVTDETIEDNLKAMKAAGIKYIELKFTYATYDFVGRSDESILKSFAVIKDLLAKYGIEVWSCHLPYENTSFTNPGAISETIRKQSEEYLAKVIRLVGSSFDVKCFVLHAGKGTIGDMNTAISQARKTVDVLRKEVAKYGGGRLCVENLVGSLAYLYDDILAIVEPFEDVYMTLDVGHANITKSKDGGISPSQYARKAGVRLGTVHIDDNLGKTDNHLCPGLGSIDDWAEIYWAFLKDCRYRGVFMYEPSGTSYSAADAAYSYQNVILPLL